MRTRKNTSLAGKHISVKNHKRMFLRPHYRPSIQIQPSNRPRRTCRMKQLAKQIIDMNNRCKSDTKHRQNVMTDKFSKINLEGNDITDFLYNDPEFGVKTPTTSRETSRPPRFRRPLRSQEVTPIKVTMETWSNETSPIHCRVVNPRTQMTWGTRKRRVEIGDGVGLHFVTVTETSNSSRIFVFGRMIGTDWQCVTVKNNKLRFGNMTKHLDAKGQKDRMFYMGSDSRSDEEGFLIESALYPGLVVTLDGNKLVLEEKSKYSDRQHWTIEEV